MADTKYKPRYADGYEWRNHRGQWFVQRSSHPHARGDGFVARSHIVIELLMEDEMGLPPGCSHEDYALGRKGLLDPKERVYHLDLNPDNDDPENLLLFPNQRALVHYISDQRKIANKEQDRETMRQIVDKARALKEARWAAAHKGAQAAAAARLERQRKGQ